ncbi:MAG: SpoIIE family protein phosphatase [Acidobacteria bacterium]|nr:SpoIIE family protein phosphatase [Acidobacteriota bacterium]
MAVRAWFDHLRNLGKLERAFAILVLLALAGQWWKPGSLLLLVFQAAVLVTGLSIFWRYGIRAVRLAIWRLRNRLMMAYLFIAVVPMLMLAVLTLAGAWAVSGQIAAYLLSVEMDRRIVQLKTVADSLGRVAPQARIEAIRRAGFVFRDRFPGVEIRVRDSGGNSVSYPEDAVLSDPPSGHAETAGLLIRERTFYLWVHQGGPRSEVVISVPVTRVFLQGLVPRLGDIQLTPLGLRSGELRGIEARLHAPLPEESALAATLAGGVPEPVNMMDLPLKWGVSLQAADWANPAQARTVFLGVATRISGPLSVMFSVDTSSTGPTMLILFTVATLIFLMVEISSVWIGVNLSRTITSAVHDLYEATVRIREGDLSHRIQVTGNDQLAELGTSFNIMAGNLQRLISAEKERQRLQAELEIAREVQAQLHPKPIPGLGRLKVASICNAARMVSGDYFDYQIVSDSQLAIVLGDVAGKGISAALLMATLQSAMRSQLRHCIETAQAAAVGQGSGYGAPKVSTAKLVSNLNQQLYASTAPEKYATFFFSVYDDSSEVLTYTNAGHLSPILIRQGRALHLDSNGMVVGAFPFARYGESAIKLESGDLLVFYTDGITEPENAYGEQFGEDRLEQLLIENSDRLESDLAALVVEEVVKWTASSELQDDMTMLIARKV